MRGLKIGFWVLLTVGIIALSIMFAQQNSDPMTVTAFDYTSQVQPKWKVLLIAAVSGAILSTVFFIVELVVLESKNVRLRRANRKLMRALEKYKKGDDGSKAINPSTSEPKIRTAASASVGSLSDDTEDV